MLKIDYDYVLTFKERIYTLLETFHKKPPILIDISKHLEVPVLCSEGIYNSVSEIMYALQEQIEKCVNNTACQALELQTKSSWNLTSVFGILLGFPTVYFFDDYDNCLSNRDLTIWKLSGVWGSESYEVTSFSVPRSLKQV